MRAADDGMEALQVSDGSRRADELMYQIVTFLVSSHKGLGVQGLGA